MRDERFPITSDAKGDQVKVTALFSSMRISERLKLSDLVNNIREKLEQAEQKNDAASLQALRTEIKTTLNAVQTSWESLR